MDIGYSPKLEFYDKDLADALKINVARFSAFKEDSFNRVLSNLISKSGSLPTWKEFREEAMKVSDYYNSRWLEAEYHQTVASANMAGKWKEYQRTKDLYPNLKYLTVGDDRVRDQHREWEGLVLPIDHPFWKLNWPPNDWGCRCDVIRTSEPVSAVVPKFPTQGKFKNNPGITGHIFDENLYAAGLTGKQMQEIADRAVRWLSKAIRYASNYTAYLRYKKLKDYTDVSFDKKSGGLKATHIKHKFDKILGHFEKEAQQVLFLNGRRFTLEVETNTPELNIEGFLDGIPAEIKSVIGKSFVSIKKKIAQSIEKGAQVCILYFPEDFDRKALEKAIKKFRGELPQIIVIHKDKIIKDVK